jgi:hypothetical protein
MVNQAKLRSYQSAKRYKYGFQVPRNYEDAVRIDRFNGNTKWQEAVKVELDSVNSYNVFIDKGSEIPPDYRKIRVHLVFDVKHDGRHKARLVADGHLTEVPLESVYSLSSWPSLTKWKLGPQTSAMHTWRRSLAKICTL